MMELSDKKNVTLTPFCSPKLLNQQTDKHAKGNNFMLKKTLQKHLLFD